MLEHKRFAESSARVDEEKEVALLHDDDSSNSSFFLDLNDYAYKAPSRQKWSHHDDNDNNKRHRCNVDESKAPKISKSSFIIKVVTAAAAAAANNNNNNSGFHCTQDAKSGTSNPSYSDEKAEEGQGGKLPPQAAKKLKGNELQIKKRLPRKRRRSQ